MMMMVMMMMMMMMGAPMMMMALLGEFKLTCFCRRDGLRWSFQHIPKKARGQPWGQPGARELARGQGGFARWVLSPCLVPVLGGVSSL